MDASELVKVIGACQRARVKVFKSEGVEIVFDDQYLPATRARQIITQAQAKELTDVHKKNIEEFAKSQLEFEAEMSVITDPLEWERGATSGND